MSKPLSGDLDALTLTEIIRLQNELSAALQRRFGRDLALCFTDVIGSTPYFQRFGDEAGRRLLQRNHDLVLAALAPRGGRIVDTAGDGVFSCYPSAERAAEGLIDLQERIARDNGSYERDHQLAVRAGLHWGRVLSDGEIVTGDAVNLCARVAGLAKGAEIRLTHHALRELPSGLRLRCRVAGIGELKGIAQDVETYTLEWRERARFPESVRVVETGELIPLPVLDLIRFGRLADKDGQPANEIVLRLGEDRFTKQISRWHFELRRLPDGFRLRPVSDQSTEVAGRLIRRGEEARIGPGAKVRLSGVMTLVFLDQEHAGPIEDDRTLGTT
jgi:class 3 adenylate cyclase